MSNLKRTITVIVVSILIFLYILSFVISFNSMTNVLIITNEVLEPNLNKSGEKGSEKSRKKIGEKSESSGNIKWAKDLWCYEGSGNVIEELDYSEPKIGESIFFLLTSCPKNSKDLMLNARQACSIESSALMHWDKDVYLLSVPPVGVFINETTNLAVKSLSHYPNIKIRHINFLRYLKNTPLERLAEPLQNSDWPVPHASDVLRFTTLNKYRGLYLDLDVITLRRMPEGVTDFVGAESQWSVGSATISFGNNNTTGQEMAQECADELARTFNGKDWGNNGPGVITRVLLKRCKVNSTIELWGMTCGGLKIYPPQKLYPLPFAEPKLFFTPGNTEKVSKKLENSFKVHYWNRVTSHLTANKPNIPFYEFAYRNCPRVFNSSSSSF